MTMFGPMSDTRSTLLLTTILGSIGVFATVALGFALRLTDPISSVVIPAEDPFTHMALIREHMRSGTLTSLDAQSALYPPGMHAFLAAVWAFTGAELAELIRLGPAVLGAIGVLGMGILLWRHLGPVGAFVGGLGYAVAPEVIFRTAMMSPTALDLALVPFFLYAMLELVGGRMRWLAVAGAFSLFFVFAHPWLLGLLGIATFVFVVLVLLAPGSSGHRLQTTPLGLAGVVAVIGGAFGIVMTSCGGYCGPGMTGFLPSFLHPAWAAPLVIAVSLAPLLLLARRPHALDGIVPTGPSRTVPLWIKLPISALVAAAIIAVTLPATWTGMPEQVELPRMIGWPMLLIAGFALVALPFMASRIAYLGAALVAATYPLVIYDVFGSPFWSHRTVVFFAIGVMVLVGVTAAYVTKWGVVAADALHRFLSRPKRGETRKLSGDGIARPMSALVAIPALLIVASVGGTVYAATPDIYPDGWYRLYPECEYESLQEIAGEVNGDPDALVVTGSWQARLVLASHTDDPTRVWYDPPFLLDENRREDTLAIQANEGGPVYVVIDRHIEREITPHQLAYLDEPPWQHEHSWCAGMGLEEARLELYKAEGPGS